MLQVGLIGYGYWGPNLARNFMQSPYFALRTIADIHAPRLAVAQQHFPQIRTTTHIESVINDPHIDAVAIATPISTHYALAAAALAQKKHVWVEKPLCFTADQALALYAIAEKHERVLLVDHTFLYTGAVEKLKSLVESGSLGELQYFDATRINLGLFQSDVNVMWDLAPHDLSILFYLFPERPIALQANGVAHLRKGIENIVYLTLKYKENQLVHLHLSWSSPVKVRRLLMGFQKKMIVYDDIEPTEKIKIYDTGYSAITDANKEMLLVDYRVGDIYLPKINNQEALSIAVADFAHCILHQQQPRSHAYLAYEIVRLLEAAQQSIDANGLEIKL